MAEDGVAGYYWAACNRSSARCTRFSLARVCATAPPLCEAGWTLEPTQKRCFRAVGAPATYADAQATCAVYPGGSLASIHSPAENNFLGVAVVLRGFEFVFPQPALLLTPMPGCSGAGTPRGQ